MASYIDLPNKEEFTDTINEIIELRSRRKYFYETNLGKNELRQEALGVLKERVELLQQVSRDMASSVAAINNRNFTSANPEILTGEVKPNAPIGDYEIEILSLGTKQTLMSSPLPDDLKLPSSRIEIKVLDEKISFEYQGGSAQSFARSLNELTQGYYTANWVRRAAQENFFVLQSAQRGTSYRFNLLKDTGDIFTTLKIMEPTPPVVKTLFETNVFQQTGWEGYDQDFSGVVVPPGAVVDSPSQSSEIPLGLKVDFLESQNVFFRMDIAGFEADPSPVDTVSNAEPASTNEIDSDSTASSIRKEIIKNLIAAREPILVLEYKAEDEVRSRTFTWGDIYNERIWINDIKLGAGLDKNVEFISLRFLNNTTHRFVMSKWYHSLRNTETDRFLPVNEKTPPENSKIRFYTIEMEREGEVIDDLVEGVSLKLHQVTPGVPVSFSVTANSLGYDEQIKNFFGQYNFTIDLLNMYLAPKKEDLASGDIDEEFLDKIGIFANESNVRRMKDRMQEIIQLGYTLKGSSRPTYLQEFGIKVFSSMGTPYHINSGKAELDNKRLETKLIESGDTIKQLFRYDSNGDFVPDDGFAYRMDRLLSDYLSPNSVFSSLRSNLEFENKNLTSSLETEKRQVESYRDKLEGDFSKVKQAQQQQKDMESWLNGINQ